MIEEISIRKAFCKYCFRADYLFPEDDIYWNRYLNLLERDYNMKTEYENFKTDLLENYDTIEEFNQDLEKYANILFDCYGLVIHDRMPILKNKLLYELSNKKPILEEGKKYLSIDLKEAFNTLFFKNTKRTKEEWINEMVLNHNLPAMLINSKGVRIQISNKLRNDKEILFIFHVRQLTQLFQTILEGNEEIIETLHTKGIKPCAIITDELIFDITDYVDEFQKFIKEEDTINGIDVHIRLFEQKILEYQCNGYTFKHGYRLYNNGKKNFLRKNLEFIYHIIDELCADKPINYEPIIRIGGKPVIVKNRIEIIE